MNQSHRAKTDNTSQGEARFGRVMQAMTQIVCCTDADGRATYFNQKWYEVTGLNESQSLNSNFLQAIDESERDRVSQSWFSAVKERKSWEYEFRIIHKYQKPHWYTAYAQPCFDKEGKVIEWVIVCNDINKYKEREIKLEQQAPTEIQKYFERLTLALDAAKMGSWYWDSFNKTQQALESSELRYSTLAQILTVGIYHCDASGNLLYVNQSWCEITGYSFDLAINRGWHATVHPEDKARVEAELQRTLEQAIPFECEFRFQREDNSEVWVFAQSVPEMNADGVLIGYAGTVTDLTYQKQSEKALRESEERFRLTFEQAAVGIAHAAPNGKFIRVNQKLCSILGYTRSELLARTFAEITYPDDLNSDLKQVGDLLAGKIPNFSMDKRYICKDGCVIWVEMTVSLVRRANGEPDYFLNVIKDISQRKKAQTQLQLRAQELEQVNSTLTETTSQLIKRNSELDQFAYVASHDLKAPLRAIANLSQWLEDDLSEVLQPENQRHLELLRQRVYRMEALINGLLQYSRIGRVDNELEKVDVNRLLKEIIDELAPPQNFTIEVKTPMPTLTTKAMMLRRVFTNLIDNAIRHHDNSQGKIEICAKDKGEYYEFAVSDDGGGISPQYHDKIFAIFQTLQARDRKESTGVGLSIVKKILETQGDTITVDSDIDKGATFRFTWHK